MENPESLREADGGEYGIRSRWIVYITQDPFDATQSFSFLPFRAPLSDLSAGRVGFKCDKHNLLPPSRGVGINVTGGRSSDITGRSLGQVSVTHRCTVGRGAKNSRSCSGAKKTFRVSESPPGKGRNRTTPFGLACGLAGFDVFKQQRSKGSASRFEPRIIRLALAQKCYASVAELAAFNASEDLNHLPPKTSVGLAGRRFLSHTLRMRTGPSGPSGGQQQVSEECDYGAQWEAPSLAAPAEDGGARLSARWEITSSGDPNQSRRDLCINHTPGGTPPPTRSAR